MNLSALATDNITEILLKIIEFTHIRQKILIQNINSVYKAGFVPKDLPVDEFSVLIFLAVNEHVNSQQLLLCDSENVKFGAGGSFEMRPIVDAEAKLLLAEDHDEYLQGQVSKLVENSLNQRIAIKILRKRPSDELCPERRMN